MGDSVYSDNPGDNDKEGSGKREILKVSVGTSRTTTRTTTTTTTKLNSGP
jgi:hypothetical protein